MWILLPLDDLGISNAKSWTNWWAWRCYFHQFKSWLPLSNKSNEWLCSLWAPTLLISTCHLRLQARCWHLPWVSHRTRSRPKVTTKETSSTRTTKAEVEVGAAAAHLSVSPHSSNRWSVLKPLSKLLPNPRSLMKVLKCRPAWVVQR